MSEYKWGDPEGWDTFCYVEKGSEKLGFFQTYLELKNLQRQLAEAREEKQQLKSIANNLLYWDTCPDHYKEKIAKMYGWEEELKEIQLKEKGDE